MAELLSLDFMRQALVAAFLVGVAAPMVGVFLVQRRLSLIGDGMGHVALAGVAIGLLTGTAPVLTALVLAVLAAVAIEVIRARGRTSADLALAVMFYGGIAAGVVLISKSTADTPANLTSYLFGAIVATSSTDLWIFGVLAFVLLSVTIVLRPWLFAVANDEEYSRATGLPVTALNIALAVLTAVTVVVSMRVVGLLLISALMILPNATAQLVGRSFATSIRWAVLVGVVASVGGVVGSYFADTPSGGSIVLLLIAIFLLAAGITGVRTRLSARRHRRADQPGHGHPDAHYGHEHGMGCGHEAVPHGDHVDYLHDGHRHAPHEEHYDEHAPPEPGRVLDPKGQQ